MATAATATAVSAPIHTACSQQQLRLAGTAHHRALHGAFKPLQVSCRAQLQQHRQQQIAAVASQHHAAVHSSVHNTRPKKTALAAAASSSSAGAGAQPDDDAAGGAPWVTKVVLPIALVLMVCNMDRICLSVAILPMAKEYGWPASVQVRDDTGSNNKHAGKIGLLNCVKSVS